MGNTTLITDWLRRRPSLPFVEAGTDKIVIGSTSSDPDILESDDTIRAIAAGLFMQYYYPEMWYAHYYRQRMEQDLGPDGLNLYSNPEGFTVPTTAQRQGAGRAAGSAGTLTSEGQLINLNLDEEGMPTFLMEMDIGAPGDSGPLGYKKARAGDMFSRIKDKLEIIDRRIDNRPGSKYRFLVIADPDFSIRGMGINYTEFEDMYPRNLISARPPFPPVLAFWNQEKEIRNSSIPFGLPVQTLAFQWKKISEQVEAVKQLFTKYQTQNRYFDGQITPAIDFNDEFDSLSSIISQIGKLLKLNGFNMKKMSAEDEVYIYIDENYNIVGIRFFQPNISLNMQYVKVGYLPHSIIEPFINSQAVVFLSRWESILDQAPSPKSKRYEVFINFIEAFANSSIRTYEINYCGPSHSPPATDRVDDALIGPPGPLLMALEDSGVVSRKDDVLSVTFPDLKLQNKILRDPVNRTALLNDQLSKTEEKAEDAIKKVMSKLREIENSEEMTVIKHVLQKIGIDKLIIEAIRCIAGNSSFDPNASSIVSDTKNLISATSKLFNGRNPPLEFTFPDLEIDLPTFDPAGGLSEMLKQMLLDVLLEVAAALVEALAELIRQLCAPEDLNGGDYGALKLNDMFEASPSPNKADRPKSLGEPTGPDTCFSAYNITDSVGRQYLTDVSEILRPAEICQLLKGNATDIVIQAVLDYNSTYQEAAIKDNLNTSITVTTFYKCLGDMVDIDEICQTLAEESIIPNLDDLCLTEEKILSSVDLFNLKNLLDMLENGISIDTPEFNLTCPTKPDYIPNPLIERSLPQLISSMAEAVSINFYLAVDGVKVVLLQVRPGGNLDTQRLLCAGPAIDEPSDDRTSRQKGAGSDIMAQIASALEDMATKFDDPTEFQRILEEDCGMVMDDLFGADPAEMSQLMGMAAEFLRNFDWSATSEMATNLYDINAGLQNGMMPTAAYDFPATFRNSIKNLVPSLQRNKYYTHCPAFRVTNPYLKIEPPPIIASGVPLGHEAGGMVISRQPGLPTLEYQFTPSNITYADGAEAMTIYFTAREDMFPDDPTSGMFNISFFGPRLSRGQPNYKSKPYNSTEMEENLAPPVGEAQGWESGHSIVTEVEAQSWENPARTAFATMVSNSLRWFVGEYGDDLDALMASDLWTGAEYVDESGAVLAGMSAREGEREALFEGFEEALRTHYYNSTQAGFTRGWARHVLERGLFDTKGILGLLLTKDNSCVNDPSKVGDLMDINGIVKDVQDEYNEAACSDDMSAEDTIEKSIIFASILLFLQVSAVKFYLQNISIFSSFKLQELWDLDLVRNFINNTVYNDLNKFMENNTVRSNTLGNFTALFRNEILNWAERKVDRPDAVYNESVLESLGIDENNREELLNDNNAIKYLLMWRMARSAKSVENIISVPGAESIGDTFIKRVIGFDHPFTSPFHGGSLQWTPQETGDGGAAGVGFSEIDPSYKFFVDSSRGVADTFGYGGFKLEPFVHWDKVENFTPSGDPPPGLEWADSVTVTVGERSIPTPANEILGVGESFNLKSKLVFSSKGPGNASLSKLRKLARDGIINVLDTAWSGGAIPPMGPLGYGLRLVDARIKYRLVYYPPLEHDSANITVTPKFSWMREIYDNAIDPDLHAILAGVQAAGLTGNLYQDDPDTEDIDEGEFMRQHEDFLLETILNRQEAFIPLSLANRTASSPEIVISHEGEFETVPYDPATMIKIGGEWKPAWRLEGDTDPYSWCRAYGNVDGTYHSIGTWGNNMSWREENVAGCIEPGKPGVLGVDPPEIWEWQKSSAPGCGPCNDDVSSVGELSANSDSSAVGTACAEIDDDCGRWVAIPSQIAIGDEVIDAEPSLLAMDPYYMTIGIPIMEFDSDSDGDDRDLSDFKERMTDNAHLYKFKQSPEFDKFKYFFSNVYDSNAALAALLMNNFYLTDLKFNSGIQTLFSDTMNGAANLFLIAMETPSGFGNRELQQVGLPGIQNPAGGGPPLVDMRGFLLKILREMPLLIFKGLAEMLDPHVFITKLIKDISGQVIDGVISGMEVGLEVAAEAEEAATGLPSILNTIDPKPEGLVEFLFCELNNQMRDGAKDLWEEFGSEGECADLNIGAPPFPDGIFPTFTTKGINLTGTLPGIFMAPPGPFGIIYLLLGLINILNLEEETAEDRGDNEDAC